MSPKEHQYNWVKSQEKNLFILNALKLSLYCLKYFIKLIQQLFPVGLYRHMINVRFESSTLLRYFTLSYFVCLCVSMHACTHACSHTHMLWKEHWMVSQNANIWLYILNCDTGEACITFMGGGLLIFTTVVLKWTMSEFLAGSYALGFYVNKYHLNNCPALDLFNDFFFLSDT